VSGGTATTDADFVVPPAIVSFAAGETPKTISISIINEIDVVGGETVNLELSNPIDVMPGTQSNAVLDIADDDTSGAVGPPKCNGLIATIVTTVSPEAFNGTSGRAARDQGTGRADKIFGLEGDDVIRGGGQ
jgi:hypothetical protein